MKHLSILTALLPIIAHAQNSLPGDISVVYSYQCEGTFLEGEGVTPYRIDCLPHQRLGFIKAKFTAHLFSSASDSNLHEKSADKAYSSSICGRPTSRLSCSGSVPQKRFGLSRRPEGAFQTKMILSPGFSAYSRVYGYAASPDKKGRCPAGLVAAKMLEAAPETIDSPLPTSFVNYNGNQNDRILQIDGEPSQEFLVHRLSNLAPCNADGSCTDAVVGQPELAQKSAYIPAATTLCIIPRRILNDYRD
jgi:hypothetical protein